MDTACVPIKMLVVPQGVLEASVRPRHVTKMKRRIRSRCACEALASFESRERKKMKLMRDRTSALLSSQRTLNDEKSTL
jgi:hypothetical protein